MRRGAPTPRLKTRTGCRVGGRRATANRVAWNTCRAKKESIVDQQRIEAVTRTLTSLPSRRDVLRGLAAAGLGLGSLRLAETEAAKHKSKANKKKGKKRKH